MFELSGFTPSEALRRETCAGAHYIGLGGAVGSIEDGKLADLVVVDGNPFEDLRGSEQVMYRVLGDRVYGAEEMPQLVPVESSLRPPPPKCRHPCSQTRMFIDSWPFRTLGPPPPHPQ